MRVRLSTVVCVWAGFESDLRMSWIMKKVNRMKSIWELSQTEIDVNTSEKVAVIKLWPPRIPLSNQQLMFFHVVMKIVFTYKQKCNLPKIHSKMTGKKRATRGNLQFDIESFTWVGCWWIFLCMKMFPVPRKSLIHSIMTRKKRGTRGRLTSWNWLSVVWGVAWFFCAFERCLMSNESFEDRFSLVYPTKEEGFDFLR